ncbi:MAG TPA: geranylgeranylglyceryl/heptaprenylglyceryl phosphate synthase [bacterium]|nr:geranylgeranylglyceryl/heptaprenylglyceryl phosphate synthase [bacterium]
MKLFDRLMTIRKARPGAAFLVLLDPDQETADDLARRAEICCREGADALLVGGSLLMTGSLDERIRVVKQAVDCPVILFPGGAYQLSAEADGILFMSLISGRNPQYLIGEQVLAAPRVHQMRMDTVPVAYMLVASESMTSVEFISQTRPLPRNKPDLAVAHALAAQYLGMRMCYLEAGSGSKQCVPATLVSAVRQAVGLSLIVGGGIQTTLEAKELVRAGADFIVIGNALEKDGRREFVAELARAVHGEDGPL